MPSQESNRLDPAPASVPSFWAALKRIFRRKPPVGLSVDTMPIPPAASLPSAPEIPLSPPVAKLEPGAGEQLRGAGNSAAVSGQVPQKIVMGEMPTPSSVVPVIIMQLATTSLHTPPVQVDAPHVADRKAAAAPRDLSLEPCAREKDLPAT